jgi:hypothetical protein
MERKISDIIFKMEHQFTLYLQRAKVSRENLPPVQLREMRRSFYGGLGAMFFLLSKDAVLFTEESEYKALYESLKSQILQFWEKEVEDQKIIDRKNEEEKRLLEESPVTCPVCNWQGKVSQLLRPKDNYNGICKCPNCSSIKLLFHLSKK